MASQMAGIRIDSQPVALSPAMEAALKWIVREGPASLARRAWIILARANGMALNPIALSVGLHRDSVRRWIVRFRAHGLAGLQHGNAGKPKNVVFDAAVCAEIRRRASTDPTALGEPYAWWSLYKLRDHLIRHGVVRSISVERVRQLLSSCDYSGDYWPDAARRVHPDPPSTPIALPLAHQPPAERRWLEVLIERMAKHPTGPSRPVRRPPAN